ncbi:MAG: hypothetical protein U9Q58_09795 [Pseudomonadota bacterium]|nr:hypothetical protein [Pseudomonadota bacterium]
MEKHPVHKKEIGSILNNLMHSSRFAKDKKSKTTPHGTLQTSFGVPLTEQENGTFIIDMTPQQIFSGIPVFVNSLGKQVLDQCHNLPVDLLTLARVDSEHTPELAALGINYVVVYARSMVADKLPENRDKFIHHLRLVFDAVQSRKWGSLLFPQSFAKESDSNQPQDQKDNQKEGLAILFPFHTHDKSDHSYFILLEYDRENQFLRLTIEDGRQSRLFLKRIPHRIAHDAGRQHYRLDIATMAEQIFTGIHRECQNQRNEYIELPGQQSALFELLNNSGLKEISGALFRWPLETAENLLLNRDSIFKLLAKTLLLFEDEDIIQTLSAGNTIEMVDSNKYIYLDLSRKGVRLNISIGKRRKLTDMQNHLQRMPQLLQTQKERQQISLNKYRLILIHHATSEVLGFIKALEISGCAALTTLFIRYQGVVPDAHLEDMLSMPEQRFRFYSLQRIEQRHSVDGAYILSHQFSPLSGLEDLDTALRSQSGNYLESMNLTAGHLFFKEAFKAQHEAQKIILIEDGGYLAPLLNRFCQQEMLLIDVLKAFALELPPQIQATTPLKNWLKELLPATFEHTANGYYHLQEVAQEGGKLIFPALTIATSKYKNVVEAEACAHSILNAVESIFNGIGKCFIHRHALIMGSQGNIGHFLLRSIAGRVTYGSASGLDIKRSEPQNHTFTEYSDINQLPKERWRPLDLFLGVTGVSVLQADFYEKLILEGTSRDLFFASGSTKTVEFEALTSWIEKLTEMEHPTIAGERIEIEKRAIKDPQNMTIQGHLVRIIFANRVKTSATHKHPYKDLYLLGDSMPINFLYYGVPVEVIDGVFEELFCLLTGFVSRHEKELPYAPAIYAVDIDVDKFGSPDGLRS